MRALTMAFFSARFWRASNRSSPSRPSVIWQAAITSPICFCASFDPATRAATFCSSTTFQSTYCSISGWSTSTVTILAARRVVPPDLMAPAARSPIRRKLIRPDDLPPPDRLSPSPRMRLKLDPVPDPYLNRRASRTHRSMMPPSFTRSSLTDWMKQACGCGCS